MRLIPFRLLLIYFFCIGLIGFQQANGQTTEESQFVADLLARMTLEEKIGQMNMYNGFYDATGPSPTTGKAKDKYEHIKTGQVGAMLNVRGVAHVRKLQELAVNESRLGIPMLFGFDVIHGYRTTFPIPLAESASWDMQAIQRSARIAAVEASAAGLNWTFAPMVDISRDARWGRVMEGAGEDPFLGSQIAKARVQGFQGPDLKANNTIAACTKHFAAYGFAESGREYNTVDIGTSTLYNIVLPPFKATVDAGVMTFMNAFNELNGIPATADQYLQRDILKGKWGFDGLVVSDWGTVQELVMHGYAEDSSTASMMAANAGSDMDMESHSYIKYLKHLVEQNRLDISVIDDAASRILLAKVRLGLFDDPYKYCDTIREQELLYHEDHLEAALDMACKSVVLLKNTNKMLPLKTNGLDIALIGDLADDKNSPLGNWRLAAINQSAVSVKEGLEKYEDNTIHFAEGVRLYQGKEHFALDLDINNDDKTGIEDAVEMAKGKDVVIMVLGEHGFQTGEGRSRTNLELPGFQQELLERVYEVNKNIVLVNMSGRPLALTWADEHIPAIIQAWQLGSMSGDALAKVLYGDYNPSGKMPMTVPRNVGQIPIYYNYKITGRPGPRENVFWSHYIDESNDPLYPFGYGQSYTDFEYTAFDVTVDSISHVIDVKVQLANIGQTVGEEVVQLYIRDRFASVTRPVKELKGFQKVKLAAGEKKVLIFTLDESLLGFYNNQGEYIFEPGEFEIMIGGNSRDVMTKHVTF